MSFTTPPHTRSFQCNQVPILLYIPSSAMSWTLYLQYPKPLIIFSASIHLLHSLSILLLLSVVPLNIFLTNYHPPYILQGYTILSNNFFTCSSISTSSLISASFFRFYLYYASYQILLPAYFAYPDMNKLGFQYPYIRVWTNTL